VEALLESRGASEFLVLNVCEDFGYNGVCVGAGGIQTGLCSMGLVHHTFADIPCGRLGDQEGDDHGDEGERPLGAKDHCVAFAAVQRPVDDERAGELTE
jgi:hypothetical protein